jgi:hypothetical protein
LVLSIVLHDLAMHLSPFGLLQIISGKYNSTTLIEFDEINWKDEWNSYMREAQRFNTKDRINIIGNEFWEFREPPLSKPNLLTGEDKKLVGEFIRRKHARLAHEISRIGFPINRTKTIPFVDGLINDPKFKMLPDIMGLLARSHNLNLRDTFQYLEGRFGRGARQPSGISIYFLMVILRISDFLQIDIGRVHRKLIAYKDFQSPISNQEFKNHLATMNVLEDSYDKETLFIEARPDDSYTFYRLKKLFQLLQKELDSSWAILGEVYDYKKQPKIKYRRVRSTLDEVEKFEKTVTYVPDHITFKLDSDLPTLLIEPLYGTNPSFGVRELLQNSIDACRERKNYSQKDGVINYKPNIEIKLYVDKGENWFSIKDNGGGMNPFIIKNYLLKTGASFRVSKIWKDLHQNSKGKSKIARSGKFGIGILAGFLIGNEIEIETINYDSKVKFDFKAYLTANNIQINKTPKKVNDQIGTLLRIRLNSNAIHYFRTNHSWANWYYLEEPQIKIHIDELFRKKIAYKTPSKHQFDPVYEDNNNSEWIIVNQNYLDKVSWKFDNSKNLSQLSCNGIPIIGVKQMFPEFDNQPRLSVFDFNGNLNLSLNRNVLVGKAPFIDIVRREIVHDLIAKLLLFQPVNRIQNGEILYHSYEKFEHPALNLKICYTEKGFFVRELLSPENKNFYYSLVFPKKQFTLKELIPKETVYIFTDKDDIFQRIILEEINFNRAKEFVCYSEKSFLDICYFNYKAYRGGHYSVGSKYSLLSKGQLFAGHQKHEIAKIADNNVHFSYITKSTEYLKISKKVARRLKTLGEEIKNKKNILRREVINLLGKDCFIPYEFSERKKKFPEVYKKLSKYLKE